jgi:hypothetical protein
LFPPHLPVNPKTKRHQNQDTMTAPIEISETETETDTVETNPTPTGSSLAPDLLGGELPKDIKSLRAMLTRIDNAEPRTRTETYQLRERRKAVAAAIFPLENGTPAPVMTADDQAQQSRGICNRSAAGEMRKQLLSLLLTPESRKPALPAAMPSQFHLERLPAMPRVILEPDVHQALADARALCAEFEIHFIDHEAEMFPEHAGLEVRARLANETDPAKARELAEQLNRLSSPGAAALASHIRDEASRIFQTARDVQKKLVILAIGKLKTYESRAQAAEAALAARFDVQPTRTGASGKYTAVIGKLTDLLTALQRGDTNPTPGALNSVMAVFGLEDLIFPAVV